MNTNNNFLSFLPSPFQIHLYVVIISETIFAFISLRRLILTFVATRRGSDISTKNKRKYIIAASLLMELQIAELVSLVGVCSTNTMLYEEMTNISQAQTLRQNAELLTWFGFTMVAYRLFISLMVLLFESFYVQAMLLQGSWLLRFLGIFILVVDTIGHTIHSLFLSFYITINNKLLFGTLFLIAVFGFRLVERGAIVYGQKMMIALEANNNKQNSNNKDSTIGGGENNNNNKPKQQQNQQQKIIATTKIAKKE
jgi:hypothetical protein